MDSSCIFTPFVITLLTVVLIALKSGVFVLSYRDCGIMIL